jgi:DNA repair photolyase
MFPFVTATVNPVAGACPFECSYCWARSLIKRHGWEKYSGPARLDEKAMRKIPDRGFVFVQDMSDISILGLEDADRLVSALAENVEATYLLLTKNPQWYVFLSQHGVEFPKNVVLGATIETNRDTSAWSKAPYPYDRFNALNWINSNLVGARTFISVEPIMEFDRDELLPVLSLLRPSDGVAVGYDNYGNGLPEPSLANTMDLIASLRARRITVFEKTLREARQP